MNKSRTELLLEKEDLILELDSLAFHQKKGVDRLVEWKKKLINVKITMFLDGLSIFFMMIHFFIVLKEKVKIGLMVESSLFASEIINLTLIFISITFISSFMQCRELRKTLESLIDREGDLTEKIHLRIEYVCDRLESIRAAL